MAEPALELEAAFGATAAALDAGDGEAADAASSRAAAACAALEAAGVRLDPAQLARLSELQARCQAVAAQALARLGGELTSAARSTRAAAAYRR